jgi:hypothetical protein
VKLQLHPDAEQELFHDAAWYDAERVILEAPSSWPLWPDVPGDVVPPIRRVVAGRFPHVIGYQVFDNRVLILTVASGRREPFYWRGRAS